jgi:hypothetical protein
MMIALSMCPFFLYSLYIFLLILFPQPSSSTKTSLHPQQKQVFILNASTPGKSLALTFCFLPLLGFSGSASSYHELLGVDHD